MTGRYLEIDPVLGEAPHHVQLPIPRSLCESASWMSGGGRADAFHASFQRLTRQQLGVDLQWRPSAADGCLTELARRAPISACCLMLPRINTSPPGSSTSTAPRTRLLDQEHLRGFLRPASTHTRRTDDMHSLGGTPCHKQHGPLSERASFHFQHTCPAAVSG